jgi:bifunctional enzyme CysN/CysC
MATGASTADLAIILIDARKGILTQTRRHAFITTLLGIRHLVLAVNKMDLVDYSIRPPSKIEIATIRAFAENSADRAITCDPDVGAEGDNVTERSREHGWYSGPTLLEHLETVAGGVPRQTKPFRMPVQWVNRPNLDFRGFAGLIASGHVKPGDASRSCRRQAEHRQRIVTMDGDLERPSRRPVRHADPGRRDRRSPRHDLCTPTTRRKWPTSSRRHLIWMADEHMLPGRAYVIKIGTRHGHRDVTDPSTGQRQHA